jgi:hypothetical protein
MTSLFLLLDSFYVHCYGVGTFRCLTDANFFNCKRLSAFSTVFLSTNGHARGNECPHGFPSQLNSFNISQRPTSITQLLKFVHLAEPLYFTRHPSDSCPPFASLSLVSSTINIPHGLNLIKDLILPCSFIICNYKFLSVGNKHTRKGERETVSESLILTCALSSITSEHDAINSN